MKLRIKQIWPGTAAARTLYSLWCPGCDDLHQINDSWQFDGDTEQPTFSPSILTQRPVNAEDKRPPRVCHSFVRNGMWEFLGDSTHALAGQTVPMVDLPEWLAKEQ